ncbi:MAG: WD40/YVTN/BNR-like repeat-containing protein [Bacteroidota bacterium]
MNILKRIGFIIFIVSAALHAAAIAQKIDTTFFQNLHWRMIGPHRGGRTVGAAGIPDQPNVFYIGVNDGGVWRTDDAGRTWNPIFDTQPTGSIGALAIAPSNPNIIYVGSGEGLQRPDLSTGDGMFKSIDGGATWKYLGLSDAQQIGAVLVDPKDPNRVFVAVLGHPYGANEERGVFRSINGGTKWEKILYKDENTGAIALAFDPGNAQIIYADLWAARQGPWENGGWSGKTSGLFKSTDGGTAWTQLTKGLPTAEQGLGRIGFAIAPSDPTRMYALVEASEHGGVYKSDDGGASWVQTNAEDRIYGRGDDFAEVKVHPKNKDIIYVANTTTYRSMDGGSTFTAIKGAPGGDDYHTIWINPTHPEIILLASDQGATISVNEGRTWSSWYNQPTAQLYHVSADNQFPYNLYSGQQESGSVGIASRGNDGEITFREWRPVAADEYAYVAPDPLHPNLVFGGKCSKYDKQTGQAQSVAPEAIRSGKYRYIRTSPLMFSPVDQHDLYLASNVLFKTSTGGDQWEVISPDLSRESPEVPNNIGIYRTPDLTKQARRGVIYALGLSPLDENVIWAGTDDGLIHVTWDGGKKWNNVTPSSITSWSKVAGIDAGHFDSKTAYAAVNRIRLDDMRPHIYRTHDGGVSWKEIVSGLPTNGPVNAVREDPVRKGLLFAGTERAVYVSFDDGDNWLSLRVNMPATSIRDLIVHNTDIAVATHGRSFWILDNITPLREVNEELLLAGTYLFKPDDAYRVRWNLNTDTPLPPEEPAGENPPDGAMIDYLIPAGVKNVAIEIRDQAQNVVRRYSTSDVPVVINEKNLAIPTYWIRPAAKLSAEAGIHRFIWDMHYSAPDSFSPSFPMTAVLHNTAAEPHGPWVLPGTYTVILNVDGKTFTQPITVKMDPRVTISNETLQEQFDLSMACYKGLSELLGATDQLKKLRNQIHNLVGKVDTPALKDSLSTLERRLKALKGDGVPSLEDLDYFAPEDGNPVRETFNGLQTKLIYLMRLLQGADAQPTAVQISDVKNEEKILHARMDGWKKFQLNGLTEINKELEKNHYEKLKF